MPIYLSDLWPDPCPPPKLVSRLGLQTGRPYINRPSSLRLTLTVNEWLAGRPKQLVIVRDALPTKCGARFPASVLEAAYAQHPERFVRKPPAPPEIPTAAWINKPKEAAAH